METLMAGLQYWQKGGWLLIAIASVCFLIWYYLLDMNFQLRKILPQTKSEVVGWENRLEKKSAWSQVEAELQTVSDDWSKVVLAILKKIREKEDLFETVEDIRSQIMTPLEGKIMILGALVTSAPLLGLLGTIFGMVETFQAISDQTGNTTEIMASGISQGLITTQFGLIIAIPGIFGIALMKKKMRQIDVRLAGLKNHLIFALRGGEK